MTSQRIHALPLHLANQIAAGEVVERPASVLKELVENSIDAGARQIDITIEGAGSQLIRVSDNGNGIHPDDLTLALSRHATSKIHSSDQLSHIDSLGFRGEALPSIASVSRLTIASKQNDQECGWQMTTDLEAPEPTAHPDGTTVSVAELFFNLPARRRFLRSDKTELNHLLTTFNRLALSRFDVGFSAQLADQTHIKLPFITDPELQYQRIARICGQAFVREAHYLEQQFEDIHLRGWVGKATAHRAQTDVQYFFINGRVIKDRIINHAIRLAYGDALPAGRQAAYVLYLTLPLDRVDVNVHPTKHEVRFRDARLVHGLLTRAVQEALAEPDNHTDVQSELAFPEPDLTQGVREKSQTYSNHNIGQELVSAKLSSTGIASQPDFVFLHQRYALLTVPEPALIDLQQAAQMLKQKQFVDAIANNRLASRAILVPVKIELDSGALTVLQQHRTLLEELAVELAFDSQSVTVKRIPFLLSQVELKTLVLALVRALQQQDDIRQHLISNLTELFQQTPLTSTEQARQILAQHSLDEIKQAGVYRKLDPVTLTSLFSN
ncbi:DNA mismatch repair endonuclease MutL [Methylophaga sp.]|uniref:DNA mismatch repair endonuclease MutL n=1 Tax=Methylophaga sp. TaxID=2024840 RepID=UPI003F695430